MWEWLKRLFAKPQPSMVIGQKSSPQTGQPRVGASSPVVTAKPVPQRKPEPVKEEPFDFASISQLPPDQIRPLVLREDDATKALGEKITARFLKDKSDLPVFPALAARILEVAKQPDIDINKFVTVVNQDPAVATRILRVANSVFYGGTTEITSTRDAVVRIGLREASDMASAVSSAALFEVNKRSPIPGFQEMCKRLWHGSMTCAFAAGNLSMGLGRGLSDRAFLGGMLHDVGKMVALRMLSDLAAAGEIEAERSPEELASVLELVHLGLGFEATSSWNLPEFVMEICMEHHGTDVPVDPEHAELHIIRVVSGMNEIRHNAMYALRLRDEVEQSAAALSLTAKQLHVLAREIGDFAAKAEVLAS